MGVSLMNMLFIFLIAFSFFYHQLLHPSFIIVLLVLSHSCSSCSSSCSSWISKVSVWLGRQQRWLLLISFEVAILCVLLHTIFTNTVLLYGVQNLWVRHEVYADMNCHCYITTTVCHYHHLCTAQQQNEFRVMLRATLIVL